MLAYGIDPIQADCNRQSRRILADLKEDKWGYVIYRTTYTPDSATTFPKAIKIITSWIRWEVYRDLTLEGRENLDPSPNNELWARHCPIIIEDSSVLAGASIDMVRSHFESWVENQGKRDYWNKYRMCIVIDDEILQLLNKVPTAEEHVEAHGKCVKELGDWFVKVVEAFPEPDVGDPDYTGWMYCSIFVLLYLWSSMGDASYMGDLACDLQNGVYVG